MDLELGSPTLRWFVQVSLLANVYGAAPVALHIPIVFTEAPRYDTAPGHTHARFPAGANLNIVESGRKRPLIPSFAASADPCVSFDGKRVLFSGKQRASEAWQICEIPLRGGTPRRITVGDQDSITPFYLPAGKIAYSLKTRDGFQIHVVPLAGGAPARLTFTRGDHIVTDVLRDGRILFEAPHPASGPDARDIYAVYPDGSGVETIRCDHGPDRRSARQLSSGDIVFEISGRLGRFTSSSARQIEIPTPPGQFTGPVAELAGGEWLASFRQNPAGPFLLHRWKPDGPPPTVVISSISNMLQPVPVVPRTAPKWFPSSLGNREGANLLCLNVYTSKQRIAPKSVSTVRVWTADAEGASHLLGSAPVAADGSFYVQIPSDRPVRFDLLDKSGRVIAAEKGWFWARKGEQRVCVGCHAGPERAPDNVAPEVLTLTQDPVKLLSPVGKDNGSAK